MGVGWGSGLRGEGERGDLISRVFFDLLMYFLYFDNKSNMIVEQISI